MLTVETPCLITCVQELNKPRYMSLAGINSAYKKPVDIFDYEALKDEPLIDPDTIGLKGSPTNVYKSFSPPPKDTLGAHRRWWMEIGTSRGRAGRFLIHRAF